jgi:hypothetical protein
MEWLVLAALSIVIIIGATLYVRRKFYLTSHQRKLRQRISSQSARPRNRWIDVASPSATNQWVDANSETSEIEWVELDSETDELQWVDIEVNLEPVDSNPESLTDDNFLNPEVSDDLDNILRDVIGTKDFYSQEEFTSGETVYLCRRHRLAFHEDSWRELESKCPECGNDAHTGHYSLP